MIQERVISRGVVLERRAGDGVTMVGSYERLEVWERAHALALRIYAVTRNFPRAELYGLVSQLRRAAVGVPTNIAEGQSRASRKDYLRFCFIARGSLSELTYLLRLARDLGYASAEDYTSAVEESDRVGRMLNGLMNYLGKSQVARV